MIRKAEGTAMFDRLKLHVLEQGQSISVALLAVLFCGALLLGFL